MDQLSLELSKPADISASIEKNVGLLDARSAELREQLAFIEAERKTQLSYTPITCGECKTHFQVKDVVYIQTHWYTPPRGCFEGDTWNVGEGQVECPNCQSRLRFGRSPEIEALKPLFRSVLDEYKD